MLQPMGSQIGHDLMSEHTVGKIQLALEQYRFELHRSIYLQIFLNSISHSATQLDLWIPRNQAFRGLTPSYMQVFDCMESAPLTPRAVQGPTVYMIDYLLYALEGIHIYEVKKYIQKTTTHVPS